MHWLQLGCVLLLSFLACGLAAVSQDRHWSAARGERDGALPSVGSRRALRLGAAAACALAVALAVVRDGAFFGVLIWGCAVEVAGLMVAMLLSVRPRWLRPLAW